MSERGFKKEERESFGIENEMKMAEAVVKMVTQKSRRLDCDPFPLKFYMQMAPNGPLPLPPPHPLFALTALSSRIVGSFWTIA